MLIKYSVICSSPHVFLIEMIFPFSLKKKKKQEEQLGDT
jgi:hypothetical protein